ncbi:MAG TPA: M23 family metallopeptidase [Polyangia bacterium]|nr:M23 family metallopeptidase [Polyangia bacterium]
MRLALVFAALIGANVYIFWLRPRTSLPDLIKSSGAPAVIAPPPAGAAQPAARAKPAADDESDARVVEGVMTDGDTVERAWKRDGLQPRTVAELAQALSRVFDLGTVRAGHSYSLRFDAEDHLRALDYRMTPALGFHVERDPAVPGAWRATRDEKPLETRVAEVGGVVGSSLYDAIKRSGESTSLVGWFVDMFAWDLNFYIDSQAGDRFKLIVEKRYLGGKFYKYGRVLAAEYQARSGTFRAFWFQPKDGTPAGYYTEHGESVVKNLLKTPLKYVRVSSAFDRHRFHPILHTEKAHLGVDYAAPAGTPVWATANGKVTAVGPRGGAGNAITIAHANGLESVYMHLQRFARGLAVGQAVRQKQVIGYVGATGLATGPHLHFSLKQNGAFVDPRALKPAREAPLAPAYRVEFADAIAPRLTALAAIEVRAPDVVAHGPSAMP